MRRAACRSGLLRHRIVAARVPRVALAKALGCKPGAPMDTVSQKRLDGVVRAARLKAAPASEPGADDALIATNQQHKAKGSLLHASLPRICVSSPCASARHNFRSGVRPCARGRAKSLMTRSWPAFSSSRLPSSRRNRSRQTRFRALRRTALGSNFFGTTRPRRHCDVSSRRRRCPTKSPPEKRVRERMTAA